MRLLFILILTLIGFCVNGQSIYKKMFGTFSIFNFELVEIGNSNEFLISNHNTINVKHTFFKIDEFGNPFDQNFIYQPIGGSQVGSHKFYFRNDSVYDFIGLHAETINNYPSVAFISRRDSSLQSSIFSKYYSCRPSAPGISSCMNFDSTYVISGGYGIVPGQYYPLMFKLDTALNISWSRYYQDYVGYVQKIIQESNGNYYLLMHLANEGMALTKTDSLGTILWCKNYSSDYRYANGMISLTSDELIIYGYKNPVSSNPYCPIEVFISKIDSLGDIIWSKKYGDSVNTFYRMGNEPDMYLDIVSQNRLIFTGCYRTANSSYNDIVMMLLDTSGNIQWARRYGNNYFDEAGSICHEVSDGGFIIGAYNNYQINNFPPVQNMANVTVIKTDSMGISDGCMEYPVTIYSEADTPLVTNLSWSIYVDSIVTEVPSTMIDTTGTPTRNENMCTFVSLPKEESVNSIVEVFPNPSDGAFSIKSDNVIESIQVTDISGRIVFKKDIINAFEYRINIPNLQAGVYSTAVVTEKRVTVVKCVVRN